MKNYLAQAGLGPTSLIMVPHLLGKIKDGTIRISIDYWALNK